MIASSSKAALVARGVLTYAPSLSWQVRNALFSFWRLPSEIRRDLATKVPLVRVNASDAPVSTQVDWASFAASLEASDGITRVHNAWALALHAENAIDHHVLPILTSKVPLSTDEAVAHHATVRRLLHLLAPAQGEYYMSFLILITILEKALYDLYHDRQRHEDTKKKKNMILRDLLHSDVLSDALPDGLLHLLKILFLPSGLNLRNLVWHGFTVPAEFPRCFACLTATLLLELPHYFSFSTSQDTHSFFHLSGFNDRFTLPATFTDAASGDHTWRQLLQVATQASATTDFIPRGRRHLVLRAIDRLATTTDELWFLFGILPVLEHALRLQFVYQNQQQYPDLELTDFTTAQIDQYYSTLDGFGQRDKHQVLLHADVAMADDRTLNALYHTLPCASLAVCLDLFMMADGPNVRAKLCHGEADLTTVLPCDTGMGDAGRASTITQLVVLSWVSLCEDSQRRMQPHHPNETPPPILLPLFEASVRSAFHPFAQLTRRLEICDAHVAAFDALKATWSNHTSTAFDDGMTRLDFVVDGTAQLSITDKSDRIEELLMVTKGSLPCGKKPTTFAQWLALLRDRLSAVQDQLAHHNHHGHTEPSVVWDLDRCLLALSDADGLSVSACMLDILSSVHRSLVSFTDRVETLAQLIVDGTARTNHRRSFLNTTMFLPVFGNVQRLAIDMVRHHLSHLRTVATARSAEKRVVSPCPCAASIEQLQRKLLPFITAFEGCTGSAEGAQKSAEKALQLALQFLESKPVRQVIATAM